MELVRDGTQARGVGAGDKGKAGDRNYKRYAAVGSAAVLGGAIIGITGAHVC